MGTKNFILISLIDVETGDIIRVFEGNENDVLLFKNNITEVFPNTTGGITIRIVLKVDLSEF